MTPASAAERVGASPPRCAGVPPASEEKQAGRLRYENWSPWQPLPASPALTPAVLAELLDGGQSFRWLRDAEPSALRSLGEAGPSPIWLGTWSTHLCRLRLDPSHRLEWSAPAALAPQVALALPTYLSLPSLPSLSSVPSRPLTDSLPWRSDPHLAQCLAAFPGLRILRQPFGETLLCFLCSATKQIVQIKQMVALLAARHGAPLLQLETRNPELGTPNPEPETAALAPHRLPTWPELATIPEPALRACLLGFRARYISETARFIAARPGWLDETESLPYAAAKARLLELPGVGEKVADCVLLFGAGKLEAFPVDTWILQSLARRYGLTGWKPAQLAQFGRAHFGPLAGLAQQYLFAYERRAAKSPK